MIVLIDHGSLFLDAAHVVIDTVMLWEHKVTVKEMGCDLHG